MKSESASYKAAGVDIVAGYRSVELMKAHVARTKTEGVMEGIGGFGGLFALCNKDMKDPVLVSGTDGVGTKLKLAMLLDKHDTIGIDCVAMCVNDVICCGAKPLFFLDYIACGKNIPEKIAEIVGGVAEGCVRAESALVGGETAEHPGMMAEDDYDLAGFSVGVVDRESILDKESMVPGDVILALPSSGVHSNGFSLVRKVFKIGEGGENRTYPELEQPLWETLLTPTKIYVKPVMALLKELRPRSMSHITGGGFYENIPRSLGEKCVARIEKKNVRVLPIFDIIAREGNIPERDMFNTYNMGVGMAITVAKEDADRALEILRANGEPDAYVLGEIVRGEEKGVELW